MSRNRFFVLVVLLWAMSGFANSARAADSPLSWSQLTVQEQQVLQPYAEQWDDLDPEKQRKLQAGASRWGRMSDEERQEAKQHLERFRELPGVEQERIKKARQWYKELPPDRRQELKEKWRSSTPEDRDGFKGGRYEKKE